MADEPAGEEWERCYRFPDADDPGMYRVACSCGKWEVTGTASEVIRASNRHDDSPWRQHIVGIRARHVEGA